jgi:SsrA-binding protein
MSSLAENKKAHFNYEILEKIEAGLVLSGAEVKSVKSGHLSLKEAFVTFHNNDAFLTNAHISPYQQAGPNPDYDPTHSRKLLLHRKEIAYLRTKALEKGLTIIPLSVYSKSRLIKVELAVGKGKHTFDKRETLKKRDIDRDTKRIIKEL